MRVRFIIILLICTVLLFCTRITCIVWLAHFRDDIMLIIAVLLLVGFASKSHLGKLHHKKAFVSVGVLREAKRYEDCYKVVCRGVKCT